MYLWLQLPRTLTTFPGASTSTHSRRTYLTSPSVTSSQSWWVYIVLHVNHCIVSDQIMTVKAMIHPLGHCYNITEPFSGYTVVLFQIKRFHFSYQRWRCFYSPVEAFIWHYWRSRMQCQTTACTGRKKCLHCGYEKWKRLKCYNMLPVAVVFSCLNWELVILNIPSSLPLSVFNTKDLPSFPLSPNTSRHCYCLHRR